MRQSSASRAFWSSWSIAFFLSSLLFSHPAAGQECSATVHCATGCCSQFGFCGTDAAHCGTGCLSTCDYKLGCDASNPCTDGTCCSKFGFCGLGQDYCSPETCVAGCDAKSDCDPGTYGADYVLYEKCPLNVCCSKWGYCGTTAEFCADQPVKRPACDSSSSNSVSRVVGYYEGWASRRSCQAFIPEDIPLGVYTHINFAFASIDPNTFAVVPAEDGDVDLYSRVTALKQQDQALKVYIAIGGWTFNDPGPTATTFSNLVGSTANQQAFFQSLISFMSTYGFDGVDIDWEYPAADDRSGSPSDFVNFPEFIKNLKLALDTSSGGRNGVTVTLPVSFWYLQHFDIINLEPWVDWFNVMSYDLHGLWDKDNKWLGPFLNSHTNLTEITEYLDLLWRNSITPGKVNLGLAFYTRTFVVSDPGCMAPACLFDAVGDPGPCTNSAGTLSNAELTDMIRNAGATSTLDVDAAVKIAAVGRNWITYDDAESWQLKVDFARSECLGGVMVWAISEDYADGTYSKQLQSVTNYRSPSVISVLSNGDGDGGSTVDVPAAFVLRQQCMWANCGRSCPSGYTTVPRVDDSGSGIMNDGSRCRGGQLRTFCCPANEPIPKCGWYDFNNGKCGKKFNSVCPAGSEDIIGDHSSEVGSTGIACNNGGFQVACCQTDSSIKSDLGYAACQWDGAPPDCNDNRNGVDPVSGICSLYDAPFTFPLFASPAGDGAVHCSGGYDRMYCCDPPTDDAEWLGCNWVPPNTLDDGFCEAVCPTGTVRLAMKDPTALSGCTGNQGGWAYCCTPRFLTDSENSQDDATAFAQALADVAQHGCGWTFPDDFLDDDDDSADDSTLARRLSIPSADNTTSLGKRVASDYNCKLVFADTFNMLGTAYKGQQELLEGGWNDGIQDAGLPNVPASRIESFPTGVQFSDMAGPTQSSFVHSVLEMLNDINFRPDAGTVLLLCPWWWDADLSFDEDPDDGGVDDEQPYQRRKKRDTLSLAEEAVPASKQSSSGRQSGRTAANKTEAAAQYELARQNLLAFTRGSEDSLRQLYDVFSNSSDLGVALPPLDDFFNGTTHPWLEQLDFAEEDDDVSPIHNSRRDGNDDTSTSDVIGRGLEERVSTGSSRQYHVRSEHLSAALWPGAVINSSPYPNGDGGDNLIAATQDSSRYKVFSNGCGPQDYILNQFSAKALSSLWVSEHIVELQLIPRLLTALLDAELAPVPSMGMTAVPFRLVPPSIIEAFVITFPAWADLVEEDISPAEVALRHCGSSTDPFGMVVADGALNAIKGKLIGLIQPVADDAWAACCMSATRAAAQEAFSYIQNVMAVFDYFENTNVKDRHQNSYNVIKITMQQFEDAYEQETGFPIPDIMQDAWRDFMILHMERVRAFATAWLAKRLTPLRRAWRHELGSALASGDVLGFADAWQVFTLTTKYSAIVRAGMKFDTSIFT